MLYEIFRSLGADLPGVGLLQYISFRAVAATLTAFVLALIFGRRLIRRFQRAGVGEDTDKTDSAKLAELHKAKRGTPTSGGLFLIGALLASSLLWARFDSGRPYVACGMVLVLWFAAIGYADDWIKGNVEGRNGLSGRAKQGLLTVGAVVAGFYLLSIGLEEGGPRLFVPFLQEPVLDLSIAAGVPFVLLAICVLTGTANAVNLTDGLDGLAIGCVICAVFAYAGISYFVGHSRLANYLLVEHVPGSGELTVMLGALIGASFGFLWFNAAPAEIFMGDVGSLPLGGALGFVALVTRTELMLLVVGGVFVVEALSVIVQVGSFKLRGKRVFRCAPLHHHFQFGGMPETRLVARIWLCAALLALGSLALFKVR